MKIMRLLFKIKYLKGCYDSFIKSMKVEDIKTFGQLFDIHLNCDLLEEKRGSVQMFSY